MTVSPKTSEFLANTNLALFIGQSRVPLFLIDKSIWDSSSPSYR